MRSSSTSRNSLDVNCDMTTHKQTARPCNGAYQRASPQRPKTLLQCPSSGIVHALPSIRSSSSKNDLLDRPATAPGPFGKRAKKTTVAADTEQPLRPNPELVAASGSAQLCPYDPDSYHSFATMEKRRCKFCGMRGPKIVPHEPCHACKTDGSGSHIISAGTHRRRSAVEARHLDHTANSSDSVLLGPRPITPERAAKRIDNPPRVSRLPPGIIRLPAPAKNAATTVPRREPFERPSSGLGMRPSERVIHDSSSCLSLSSLFHRRPNSPINQPSCVTPAQVLTPPFPQMRGGAESPGEISPTLFWLAGGTGRKPIKFSGWKQSRPKQRMGGLFGMAVFGDRYGQEYTVEANIVEDAEVECSASMKVTIGNEEVEGGAVTSSSISASSSCASPKADSVKEIAAVAEEAVPEPVVEPVQQGLTPPPNEPADDVPLCSGALPVEPTADAPDDIAAPSPPTDGKVQADDAIVIEEKKPHET